MKYDSMRKIERNKKLVDYARIAREAGQSWKEIGEAFNITGSRAWRIYKAGNK